MCVCLCVCLCITYICIHIWLNSTIITLTLLSFVITLFLRSHYRKYSLKTERSGCADAGSASWKGGFRLSPCSSLCSVFPETLVNFYLRYWIMSCQPLMTLQKYRVLWTWRGTPGGLGRSPAMVYTQAGWSRLRKVRATDRQTHQGMGLSYTKPCRKTCKANRVTFTAWCCCFFCLQYSQGVWECFNS